MGGDILSGFFEGFLTKSTIFIDKKVLQTSYRPQEIIHREQEVKQIAQILAPALKGEKPSNVFIYGKTGTGKTLTTNYTTNHLKMVSEEKNTKLNIIYTNCKLKRTADTEYRLVAQLLSELGKPVPATGLPTETLYRLFFSIVEHQPNPTILILDEIDYLVSKVGDGILYNFTRMHETTNAAVSIVGISNDVTFVETLDPRVRSSLSEEELIFAPYNALQIQDILRRRSALAFKEGAVEHGVVEKCAAYAAREHGDARRALELLRVAGEIADRNGQPSITHQHIDSAENKIDRDRIYDTVVAHPKQYHMVLFAIFSLNSNNNQTIFTGDVYTIYKKLCDNSHLRPLTQRRISDILNEFDMQGIITAKIISKGRYGRTREISMEIPDETKQRLKTFLSTELGK